MLYRKMCDKAEKYLEKKLTMAQEKEMLEAILQIEKDIQDELRILTADDPFDPSIQRLVG